MGSRLLARALNQLMVVPPAKPQAELNQIVFAAPDIDPKTFSGFAKVFTQSCRRCTLYASSRDLALTASRWIYRSPRAGDTGGMAWMTHGVDTIDASDVDQSLMGHSYFCDRRTVLADLHEVIEKGTAPSDRYGLREVVVEDTRYWTFKP
jgi:esterase/lipase superfamily enzyme